MQYQSSDPRTGLRHLLLPYCKTRKAAEVDSEGERRHTQCRKRGRGESTSSLSVSRPRREWAHTQILLSAPALHELPHALPRCTRSHRLNRHSERLSLLDERHTSMCTAMINVWLPNPVECVYCVTDSIPTQLVTFRDLGAGVAPSTDEVVWAHAA